MLLGVTGATGKLGRLVIAGLLRHYPAASIVALARSPEKAADILAKGVIVRQADYDDPATLASALVGIERLLLVSSSEVGRRVSQHRHVIEAALWAGVQCLASTSLLHADRSPLQFLAEEHRATEHALQERGLEWVILRHSWYTENFEERVRATAAGGEIIGPSGAGWICPATRADYAEAAVVVLTTKGHEGRIYELASDEAWTMTDLAQVISEQIGRPISYRNLEPPAYAAFLRNQGVPESVAELLSSMEAAFANDALYDESHSLSQLIGRPTTSLREIVRSWLI